MRRDQLPPHKTATYVMPRWQALYVSTNKAACSSLKWLVADIQGEDRERFHKSVSREFSRTMTVHRRDLWRKTPMAARLSDAELAKIDPAGGWFIFGAVRHPSARLFSAWQSKLLLREPWWVEQFGGQPWFPTVPKSGDDIVSEFVRFVEAMRRDPRQRLMRNRHFAPQKWMLAPEKMPYTRIYKTSEIPQLLEDFGAHLRERGYKGELPLKMERINETPLKPITALFPDGVLRACEELYADDFKYFDYGDVLPGGLDDLPTYPDSALPEIHRLIERAERIGDLALEAQRLRAQVKRLKAKRSPIAAAVNGRSAHPVRAIAARAYRKLAAR